MPDNKVTEKPLEAKDIPVKAKEYFNKNYVGWVFQKGVIIYKENKVFIYSMTIKVGNDYYYVIFDANANFISARRG